MRLIPPQKFICLLIAGLCFAPGIMFAQDTADCSVALSDAETAYFNGDFDSTIALLQPCLQSGNYTQIQGVRAYALLGRTQFVLSETDSAGNAIQDLYKLDPEYEPDPLLPPNFSAFILEVKQQMIADGLFPTPEPEIIDPTPPVVTEFIPEEEPSKAPRKRKALLFGGGAALAVAAGAVILLSGNSGGDPKPSDKWPLPPAHPSQ